MEPLKLRRNPEWKKKRQAIFDREIYMTVMIEGEFKTIPRKRLKFGVCSPSHSTRYSPSNGKEALK